MRHEFLTLDTIPGCLKKIGNNLMLLRYGKIREMVNSDLRQYSQDGIRIRFDVDDQDQLTMTFYNNVTTLGDTLIIRSNELEELIENINKDHIGRLTKNVKNMKMKTKKSTSVAVTSNGVIKSSSVAPVSTYVIDGIELLVNFVIEHYAGSGSYCEIEKFIDVTRLFREKTNGAVVSIIMDHTDITIRGINNFTMSCSINCDDLATLKVQVRFMLKAAIDWHQQQSSDMSSTSKDDTVTTTVETNNAKGNKIAKKHSNLRKISDKVVNKYNKLVYDEITDLEGKLKGKNKWASSQLIRSRLAILADKSGLRTKDRSGKYYAANLVPQNIDLINELCSYEKCKVPSFLEKNPSNLKGRMKG